MSKTVAIGIQNFRDMIEKKCFGEHGDIYNPWSILNFLDTGKLATYWANTSSNSLVGKLVRESDEEIKALLADNLKEMNIYMNQVALQTFSYFDAGTRPSETGQPENFYHGFVLGLLVELSGAYTVTSNRESGYGRYDVVIEPLQRNKNAYIFEFKVHDPDEEQTLSYTVASAHQQIREKRYEASLIAKGIPVECIRTYDFAFEGKKVMIG